MIPYKKIIKILNHLITKKFTLLITYRKVHAGHAVEDDKDVRIGQLLEAKVQAHRKEKDQQLQVKVEGGPGGGLVLGNGGDDGDVVLGVGGIEQRVKATRPGGNF